MNDRRPPALWLVTMLLAATSAACSAPHFPTHPDAGPGAAKDAEPDPGTDADGRGDHQAAPDRSDSGGERPGTNGGDASTTGDPEALVAIPSGLADGMGTSAGYQDMGPASGTAKLRALIELPLRDAAALDTLLRDLYEPTNARFRKYLSAAEVRAGFSPTETDVAVVMAWLESKKLTVPRQASNRLLLQVNGTVADWNQAFGVTLHAYKAASNVLFGAAETPRAPAAIAQKIRALVMADPLGTSGTLPADAAKPSTSPPTATGMGVAEIAEAYGVKDLHAAGARGQGIKIGIVTGGAVRRSDAQTFWQAQGITRADFTAVPVMEPPTAYNGEATLDVQWAGGLAPGADLILYQGTEHYDLSLLFAWNEAIGRGEVQVITTSFSHNESSRAPLFRQAYETSAKLAAAMGITTMAASGDTAVVDVPATCPHVLAVGGTVLSGGSETAWSASGSGPSTSFEKPWYQATVATGSTKRATTDVGLNAENLLLYYGGWQTAGGTSFASPSMAGVMGVVNSARSMKGKPPAGFLNGLLYTTPAVQDAFRDITTGGTSKFEAGVGWDYPTGWGSPRAVALSTALP